MPDRDPISQSLSRLRALLVAAEEKLDKSGSLLRYARQSGYIEGLLAAKSIIENPAAHPVFYTPPRIAAIARAEQTAPRSPAPRSPAGAAPAAPSSPAPAPHAVQATLSLDAPAAPKAPPPPPSAETSYAVPPLGGVGGTGTGAPPLAHIVRYTHALDWLRARGDEARFEDFSEIWRIGRRTNDRRVRCAAMNCALLMEKKGLVEIARDPLHHNHIVSIRRRKEAAS